MKLFLSTFLCLLLSSGALMADGSRDGNAEAIMQDIATEIIMLFDQEQVIIQLFDNPVGQDFLSRLPLIMAFEDYAQTEKISYLNQKLDTRGGARATEVEGDFCYYAPWGNLAVFYKGYGHGKDLYVLGRIVSGKEILARQNRNFSATIEILKRGSKP